MSCTLRTNGWTLRLIIMLQLITWCAVSIVLLQKGVSSLRRRTELETNSHVIETDPSIDDSSIESATMLPARLAENERNLIVIPGQKQSIDKNAQVIICIDPKSPLRNNWSDPGLIRSALRDAFEIVSAERGSMPSLADPLEISTISGVTSSSSWKGNHITDVNERIDNPGSGKSISSKILRVICDKKREISANEISQKIRAQNVARPESASELISKEEKEDRRKYFDFVRNAWQLIARASSARASSTENKIDDRSISTTDTRWRSKSEVRSSHRVSTGGTAIAVAMIAIGAVMLLLGPTVIILRLLDQRRRARKLQCELAASSAREEDLPPTYEQAVSMIEAPRYSTLVLNDRADDDGRSSSPSSPPPSPTPSSAICASFSDPSAIKSHHRR